MKNKAKINCLGIIMDGNRRFAKAVGESSWWGHRAGADKLKEVAKWARAAGVRHLVVYAFSSENWQRTPREVNYLLGLFSSFVTKELPAIIADKIKLRFIGDLARLPASLRRELLQAEEATAEFKDYCLWIAISYGGRAEILAATKKLISQGVKNPGEKDLASALWTAGLPDPDLIVRTGGARRLSNFLLWQAAYSELAFTNTFWPALTEREFKEILADYALRQRNFGR